MQEKLKALLRIALVALFLSYYAGVTLFSHTHTYSWGKVTHSHPYIPSGHHSHTTAGLQMIDNLSQLHIIASTTVALCAFMKLLTTLASSLHGLVVQRLISYSLLRAPPSIL